MNRLTFKTLFSFSKMLPVSHSFLTPIKIDSHQILHLVARFQKVQPPSLSSYWITLQRNIALHTVWLIFWWMCRYLGIPKLSLLVSQQIMIWANTSSVVLSWPPPPLDLTSVRNLDLGGLRGGGGWPALTRVEHSELSQSLSLAQPPVPASSPEGVADLRTPLLPFWYRVLEL